MKISYKLVLMFVLISLVPIASISYLSMVAGAEIITTYVGKHLTDENALLMSSIASTMQSRQQDIVALSKNCVLQNKKSSAAEIKKELLKYVEKDRGYTTLSFFDMNRVRLVDTKDLDLGKQHQMVAYWEDALAGKISAGRDVRIAEELKVPIIYFAAPVFGEDDKKPLGVVVARYNPKKIQTLFDEFAEEEKEKEGSEFTLTDKDRNVIFSSNTYYKERILKEKIIETPSVLAASSGESGVVEETEPLSRKTVITSFVKEKGHDDFVGNGWTLFSSSDKDEVYSPITDFRSKVILLSFLFFALAALVGFLYSKGITKSLKNLVRVAEKASTGDLKERATVKSKDELGYLAKVFNQMLGNLEESGTRLKEVNASLEQRVVERTKELNEAKAGLEKTVEQRTAELKEKLADLERFEKMAVGRELRMTELKEEIEKLKSQVPQAN